MTSRATLEALVSRPQKIPQSMLRLSPERARFFSLIGYEPFQAQRQFHWSCDHFRFPHAGSGGRLGKSKMAAYEGAFRLETNEKFQVWLVAENYGSTKKEYEYLAEVLVEKVPKHFPGLKPTKAQDFDTRGPSEIRLPNGSWVATRSADNLNSLLGEELDLIILCEGSQLPVEAWLKRLNQRISTRMGQVIIPTTAAGLNWLHDVFFVPALQDWAPAGLGYQPVAGYSHTPPSNWRDRMSCPLWPSSHYTQIVPSWDSPHYPVQDAIRQYEEALKVGDLHPFLEQVMGVFSQSTSLVYRLGPECFIGEDDLQKGWKWVA